MRTRALVCSLDANCERPEERRFEIDPRRYAIEHRWKLVRAGLIVLSAYNAAARPVTGLTQFGRYEEWSDLVRGALVWLDQADPCDVRRRLETVDPVREQLVAVLTAWRAAMGFDRTRASEAIRTAEREDTACKDLHSALLAVAAGQAGHIDAKRLGRFLTSYEGRIHNGMRIVRAGTHAGTTLWRLELVDGELVNDECPDASDVVGLVGLVGSVPSIAGAGARAHTHACTHARAHEESSEINPPKPPNPPDMTGETTEAPCGAAPPGQSAPTPRPTHPHPPCGRCEFHRVANAPNWICTTCFAPDANMVVVERMTVGGGDERRPTADGVAS
jgi:hypothetical protein